MLARITWMTRLLLFGLVAGLLLLPQVRAAEPTPPEVRGPLSPPESLKHIRLTAGLKLELVAAEPEIESPVAMAFDEDSRLFVVEMRDYPNGPAKGEPPQGRIKLLEDRDGDGRYEKSSVFADELLFANGLLPWKGGLIVTAAPHILYLKDTDGDGKADQREILYEGFAALNPQLRVSHPILGLDGWVYVANGLRGGQIIRNERRGSSPPAKPINLSGMDFRFDLIHDQAEAVSGMGQYGNTFDDWGRRFVCDNRHHLRHVVLPSRCIKRNPYLAVPEPVQDISDLTDGPLNSGGKIYPLSKNWTTSNLHVGRFTAACGVHIYRGDLLPKEFQGCAFTCDPTGNLVHQEVLTPQGATFRSKPPKEGVEFLATPEEWFRPVSLAEGPDGALYLVDMYRAVIEHPEFMPAELKNRPDLLTGKERGRIWRIVPEKHQTKMPRLQLSKATVADLVKLLEHPGGWWRMTAHRLLLEGQDKSAIEPLRKVVTSSKEPLARLHAAWLLQSFDVLDEDLLVGLLKDDHPCVREQGLLLSEHQLPKSKAVQERVRALADDKDSQVRFQVALSLGEWDDHQILEPLATIAKASVGDRWTRAAVISSVPQRGQALLEKVFRSRGTPGPTEVPPEHMPLFEELCAEVGARSDPPEVARLLADLGWIGQGSLRGYTALGEGMNRRGIHLGEFLTKSLPKDTPVGVVEGTFDRLEGAATTAGDRELDVAERVVATRLLAHAPWTIAESPLRALMTDEPAQEVRLAVVRALSAHRSKEVPELLMKSWASYTPTVRREVTEAMLRQPDRILFFLDEIEAKRVKPGDIDTIRTRQLLNHTRADIRDKAKKLLQQNLPADRQQVLDKYKAALNQKGDPKRGLEVFRKQCATCHKLAGVGVDVGPDISDVPRTRAADAIMVDILNPNQAIDNNYISYLITTKSGKSATGIIVAETASNVTLKRAENQTDVFLRQDIDEIQSSGVSLMPEGVEKNISVDEMADLLAFIKNWRYLDGTVPLGKDQP